MMEKNLNILKVLLLLMFLSAIPASVWADDFTVERAVNLSQLDSWADISKFQWQEIEQLIQDDRAEMEALKTLFYDPAPKDTVGFYNQIYKARDNQYIVLRLDKAQGNRPFRIRATAIRSTSDPSKNMSQVFAAENYVFIMPPIGENQLELKIWPLGEGEETAKTYTFNIHSYGSASLRTVMLDKSRIIEGNYDLQLIYYDSETEKSDTSYIDKLVVDKLYSFYDYKDGDLVEAYLRLDGFRRIKLKTEWWARDAVTHVNDNSVTVETGSKMPFKQHKRLDAPNPTYLDSRLFSHHDTLWVNIYVNNEPSYDEKELTIHAIRADENNKPTGKELLGWGKDPVSGRLYVLTDGLPATIECYRNDCLPKLCMYPGSYDHRTGIIEGDREEVDIHLEKISGPVTKPTASSAVLSTLTTTTDRRGNFYVSRIQQADIIHELLTETVYYDEYASHKDTMKLANGLFYKNYAQMVVGIVSPNTTDKISAITLKKVKSDAEENNIAKETLEGDTTLIHHELYDYNYWTAIFDLREYIPIEKSGRPAIAFDGQEVKQLPILYNRYIDLQKLAKDAEEVAKERLSGDKAGDEASGWVTEVAPSAMTKLSFKIPLEPPFYIRLGLDADFFKAKKLSFFSALGIGYQYDLINQKSNMKPLSETQEYSVSMGSWDDYGNNSLDATPALAALGKAPKNFSGDPYALLNKSASFNAFAELYSQYSLPMTLEGNDWKQWLTGMQWLDEASLRAELNVSAAFGLNYLSMLQGLGDLAGGVPLVDDFCDFLKKIKLTTVFDMLSGTSFSGGCGARLNITTGFFAFDNTKEDGWGNPLKNHILAFKFMGQVYLAFKVGMDLDIILAGASLGLKTGAGVNFKYAAGSRLDCRNPFSGSAWSWFAGLGAYYKVKFLCWSKSDEWDVGQLNVEQKLIEPKSYKNPFHKNFAYYLSDEDDPDNPDASKAPRRAVTLPGDLVASGVDYSQPVKFLAGGDSIVYQRHHDNPNDYTVDVAMTGNPQTLSNQNIGGCTDYDAASVPGTDLVVLEQATAQIAKEDLEDSLHLDETINRASRVYGIYYTKKNTKTKWYSPKPIYSSAETTSFKPRVALAENGTGVAVWQEGNFQKGSWVAADDTVQLADIVMNGQLMMSRFDGNETWSEPIPLQALDENFRLNDYRIAYDGQTAFIIARKEGKNIASENFCLTVDATNNVTKNNLEQTDDLMQLRRIGDSNVLAWVEQADTASNSQCFRVQSVGMDGKAKKGINTSLVLNGVDVEEFRIVPDLQAKSLDNVALLWREKTFLNDSTKTVLRASRLVPNRDGSFGLGSPITAVSVDDAATIYGFDGYMSDDKIQVGYVATDASGNAQLNKVPAYFGNAFEYSVLFESDNNQGFQCNKDEVSLLITVNNLGTSTINGCVLKVDGVDKEFPFDMNIQAGSFAKERVTIPYVIGSGVNTTLTVTYDDVLATSTNSPRRAGDNAISPVYEQRTKTFYPYRPRLECFVAAQQVDENGDNKITICVRNYARRQPKGNFAILVGLKDNTYNSIVYYGETDKHNKYETKKLLFNNTGELQQGDGYMFDYGSYSAGYVTLTVPGVTEKQEMYVGATLAYKVPLTDIYMRVSPSLYSGSNNSGIVTLYPSPKVTAVEKVFNNDDKQARLHVTQQASQLVVTGAKAGEQVRLYQANGAIIAQQTADDSGKATFRIPSMNGVALVSDGNETVKFVY